jgi:tetratricopeptide (TPR) repeat protein
VRLSACWLVFLLPVTPAAAQTAKAPAPVDDLAVISGMVDRGELGPAEQRLRRILAQGGGPAARDLLGVVLLKQDRFEEAERELKQVLAANPASLSARQHLARLYLAQKRDTEATVELRRAARLGDLERDLGLKLASIELEDGHPALAEVQLRSVAERFHSVQALLGLARLQLRQKDQAHALETLRRALALAPNAEDVLSLYAETLLAARAPVPAAAVLESLTRLYPSVGQYHYLRGIALLQVGDSPASVESLQEAERLEPNRPLALIALGLAQNSRKLYAEAKPFLVRAVDLDPESVEGVAALAEAEEGLGELKEAEEHAQRALGRDASQPIANLVVGMVRMREERYAEARDALEKAVAAAPSLSKAHYQLSLAYARLGDPARSAKSLELYQRSLRETEERVRGLRGRTGASSEGTQP